MTQTRHWQMYEFARGAKLFDPFWRNEESGLNPSETHLAQMTGLLGQFSSRLLAEGQQSDVYFDQNGWWHMSSLRVFVLTKWHYLQDVCGKGKANTTYVWSIY